MNVAPLQGCELKGCPLAPNVNASAETCQLMGALGFQRCPGLAQTPEGEICSLPGELTEALLLQQPDAPGTLVLEAMKAVVSGRLDPARLPLCHGEDAYLAQLPGPIRWRTVALALEAEYADESI